MKALYDHDSLPPASRVSYSHTGSPRATKAMTKATPAAATADQNDMVGANEAVLRLRGSDLVIGPDNTPSRVGPAGSPTGPFRVPFFEEGPNTLLLVGGRHGEGEEGLLVAKALVQGQTRGGADRRLCEANGKGAVT